MKCPVCGSELNGFSYKDEIWGMSQVVEDGISCSVCDYYDRYSYGHYEVVFGKHYFSWGHNTNQETVERIRRDISVALSDARPMFPGRKYRYYQVDCIADIPF